MSFTNPHKPSIPDNVKEVITAVVSDALNQWLAETRGYPMSLQLTRLGIRMCEVLEDFYQSFPNLHSQDKPKE